MRLSNQAAKDRYRNLIEVVAKLEFLKRWQVLANTLGRGDRK
jgi:hypothetical protein